METSSSAIFFQIQSTMILLLMYLGVYKRYHKVLHRKIMIFTILWDILLVLQIEFTRKAIEKASKTFENSSLLNTHVAMALICVLLYFALIYTGQKVFKGDFKLKSLHKFFGISTIILRTLVYITSFFIKA